MSNETSKWQWQGQVCCSTPFIPGTPRQFKLSLENTIEYGSGEILELHTPVKLKEELPGLHQSGYDQWLLGGS